MIRSRRDSIPNPTFDSLLEKAKIYTSSPLNEQGGEATPVQQPQGNKPASQLKTNSQQPVAANNVANANTSTSGTASTEPKKKPDEQQNQKEQTKPAATVAPKDVMYISKIIATNLLTLLSAYQVNSPAVAHTKISGLDTLGNAKNMGDFINSIKSGLDSITTIINSDPDSKYYADFISAKDQALKSYEDALSKFPDSLTMEIPDLGAYIKPAIATIQSSLPQMAAAAPKDEKPVAPTPAQNAGFGEFMDFKTYEAILLESQEDDDNQSLDKLKSDLQRAEDKQKEGKEKAVERIKKRIFNELVDGCEDVMGRVNAVRLKISIGASNPNQANFQSFKMEEQFVAIATDIHTMRDQLNTQDPESIESVNRLITRFETKLKQFVALELKFRDLYNNELDELESRNDLKTKSPDAFNSILQGNAARQKVETFSVQNKKAVAPAAATGKPADASGNATTSLKIAAPIKAGMQKDKNGKTISNPEIAKFQKLVIDKFKGVKAYKNSPLFQKFVKYSGDGFYGKTTAAIVEYIRAGFHMDTKDPTITQELIDKIEAYQPAPIKESLILNFDSYSITEQFDEAAADRILAVYDKGDGFGKKKEDPNNKGEEKKAPVVNKGQETNTDQASHISKAANLPKVSNDDIAKIKNDAIQGFKVGQLTDDLVKMGAIKNENYGKDGATCIAMGKGVKFYENGAAMRSFDKELGTFDPKAGVCKWNDGTQDKIDDLVKTDKLPSKYSKVLSDLINDVYGDQMRNKQLYKELMKWTPEQVKLLAMAYSTADSQFWTKGKKHNLDKDLGDEMTNTDEIRAFQKKFASSL